MNLKHCLTFKGNWGGKVNTASGPYWYHDYGNTVLGVAHTDSVLWGEPLQRGDYVFAPQLDDRLGVWCLLDYLPSIGVCLDVLLTDNEEKCRSTAIDFIPSHRYNWVIEFDRAGTDIVYYQYKPFVKGFKEGVGSYSDICDLALECRCANLGIGYRNQHTHYCHANLADTRKQCKKFAKFWKSHKGTFYPDVIADFDDNDDFFMDSTWERKEYF
jgi:hypothetical protein